MTPESISLTRRHVLGAGATLSVTTTMSASPTLAARALAARAGGLSTDAVLELTATEAVAAISSGRLSAEGYVRALLDRARDLDDLRLVITPNARRALARARRVDDARRAGKRLPSLAGLPILVKDNINTRKLRTTGGTPALGTVVPKRDAEVLRRLVRAGAVVLGKTNMHELAFGVTTTNFSPFAGFAQNPYDRSRIPGGSSGGTAGAIAARIVPAGLGTDTGSSVRLPAAFTGVAGLRPSVGDGGRQRRYPTRGVLPISHTLDTVGPMGRTVADLALLDTVVSGQTFLPQISLRGLRLGVPHVLWSNLDDRVEEVARAARHKLEHAGVELVRVDLPDLVALANEIVFPIAVHEPNSGIPAYLAETGVDNITIRDIGAQVASPDVKDIFGAVLDNVTADAYPAAINSYRPEIQRMVHRYFRRHEVDALLFPTAPVLPARIDPVAGSGTLSYNGGAPVDTFATSIRHTQVGSAVGMPGVSLPGGQTSSGLPIGLSLEGPIGSDRRLLAVALAVEKALGVLPAPTV